MKRFYNQNDVHPLIIKEESTEQKRKSSPEDLQPALHAIQPNVAARKTGIGSRIVPGVNDVLSTNDRGPAQRTTTEDNHQTPTTTKRKKVLLNTMKKKPSPLVPSNSTEKDLSHALITNTGTMKGRVCAVVSNTGAIRARPRIVLPPSTKITTTHKPSPPVPTSSAKKDGSRAVVTNTGVIKESCTVVPITCALKDPLCAGVPNTGTMKARPRIMLPPITDTTIKHKPSPPVPSSSAKKDRAVVTSTGVRKDRLCAVVSKTGALKAQPRIALPPITEIILKHKPSPPVPSSSAKKDGAVVTSTGVRKARLCAVVSKTGAMKAQPRIALPPTTEIILKHKPSPPVPSNSAKQRSTRAVFPPITDTTMKHKPFPPVPFSSTKKDKAVVTNTGAIKDRLCAVVSKAGATKAWPRIVLPPITKTITKHKPSPPVPSNSAKKDWAPAVDTKSSAIKEESCTVDSNTCTIKGQPRAVLSPITDTATKLKPSPPVPSSTAKKGWSYIAIPDIINRRPSLPVPFKTAKKDWSRALFANTDATKDVSSTVVSNTGAMKDRSHTMILNTIAKKDRSRTVKPYTGTMTNHKLSLPVPSNIVRKPLLRPVVTDTGAIRDRLCKVVPNTRAMKDQSCTVLTSITKITMNQKPSPPVQPKSSKKQWSRKVLPCIANTTLNSKQSQAVPSNSTRKDQSHPVLPYVDGKRIQSRRLLLRTIASKFKLHAALGNTDATKNRSPARLLNAGAMRDRSPAVQPNYAVLKHRLRAVQPNADAMKDRLRAVQPNADAIKDLRPAVQPNTGAMKDLRPAVLPNAGALKDRSSAVLLNAGTIKDESPTVVPKTNVMCDTSNRLALEKGFTIHSKLGQGSFGKVMLASHPASSRMLAVKIIEKANDPDPNFTRREGRLLKAVRNNPFVTHLYGSFESEEQLVLVMEYLHGGDLSNIINRVAPLPEDTIRNLTAEILCGLKFLHSKDIMHRDLKPENILLDEVGHAKISDLGLSESGVSEFRRTTECSGTLHYMAPEVLQGDPHFTVADYFSLGLIVYEMAVGKHPFWKGQKSAEEMLGKVLTTKINYPPEMSRDLRDLIQRLLCIDQETRKTQVEDLKRHPFFKNFDWAKLEKRPPPLDIHFGSASI